MMSLRVAVLAPLLLSSGAAMTAEPFTVDHLVRLHRVGAPALSPDGTQVVFPVRSTDMDANRGTHDLWLRSVTGDRAARPLTTHPASDTDPQWSPDGRHVYFLSSRSGSNQLWRIAADGGEATQASDYPLDIGTFKLAPDGKRVALTFSVDPACEALACTAEANEQRSATSATGVVYDQLFVRHWDHWLDHTMSRLFADALTPDGVAGNPLLISGPVMADVPSRPFGGAEEYAFSADGTTLYFAARTRDVEEPWSTNFDLYAAPVSGGEARNLTVDNKAWDTQPVVSSDGRYLAWLAMSRPGFEADRFQVMLRDLRSGDTRSLTADWDRSPGALAFAPDSRSLFLTAQDVGQKTLWRLDIRSGELSRIVEQGYVGAFDVGNSVVVFGMDDLDSPVELHAIDHRGRQQRQLTHVTRAQLEAVSFGEYEQFSFPGWNDETVYGYVVKPVGFEPGRRYPVAFLIHGGPQGSFSNHFHYRWNPQTYAGQGFAAVMIDFHGSTGYGQAFTDAITGDWGGKPLEDLQKGLAAALERYEYLDGDRVCALGASYGGYMINWIAGQWPDRFDCLVNHDGIFDNRMMYYATEELWFPEWEHGGPYWKNPQGYEQHNPANHVDQWQTPMLVIHGALDYRVPLTQGLAAFTALQRRGIESRFVHYPDENHWVLKPHNSIQWHNEVNAWLHRYLD